MKKKKQPEARVTEKQPSFMLMWLITISMLAIVVATLMPILFPGNEFFRYLYAGGAAMLLVGRIFTPYRGNIFRVKRLYRIEFWSAMFFCVATFFLFYEGAQPTDWLAFTLAGGALQIYTSIMIPRALAKSKCENKE